MSYIIQASGLVESLDALRALLRGLGDLTGLHELLVITTQVFAQAHWPTAPPLSGLTLAARRRGGSTPLMDSGRFWRSVTGFGQEGGLATFNEKWGRFGSNLVQAALMNFGGEVTPKKAKFLAVPMSPEGSAAGGPRSFPGPLALIPMKNREGYLLVEGEEVTITRGPRRGDTRIRERAITGGRATAHFMLAKQVYIPPRRWMPTPEELLPDLLDVTLRWLADMYPSTGG